MKISRFALIVIAGSALFGCATPPSTKNTPGAAIKPEDLPATPPNFTNDLDRPPKAIRAQNPVYPPGLLKRGVTGVVTVVFVVDTNGDVASATAVNSPDPLLSEAAVNAVLQWKFLPGQKNGKKVNTRMLVPFTFSISTEK
jgi:TonB family protein